MTSPTQRIIAEAADLWPQGNNNGLGWPTNVMMVSQQHKILYMPVAKCACTSLKSFMIGISDIAHADRAVNLDIHIVTDRFNTGALLKDLPIALANEILLADDYFKFGIVRDPFERLVSAYLEKFVYKRFDALNQIHSLPVLQHIQGTSQPDVEQGISFDQFLAFIISHPTDQLDPHWRPQYLYFEGVKNISRIFRFEDMLPLQNELKLRLGGDIKIGHRNRITSSGDRISAGSSLSAAELDALGPVDKSSFLSPATEQAVKDYFARDYELYSSHS